MIQDLKVALVFGDPSVWIDRQIMGLHPVSAFSHAAFVITLDTGEELWYDMKFQLFRSALRCLPARSYPYHYALWRLKGLNESRLLTFLTWISVQQRVVWHYDFGQGIWIWVADKLGLPRTKNPLALKHAYNCFEFIQRGLEAMGYNFEVSSSFVLAPHLEKSGHLERIL